MKRIGNIYENVISIENLYLADKKARKGKRNQYGVKVFDKERDNNILDLHETLKNRTYQTSAYKTFMIADPKPREIFCLPYFPDRIVHHSIMNILEEMFVKTFTADTYSCIKGKGIHSAHRSIRKALIHKEGTEYCLKLDIKKFYPSVDHEILKFLLRKKIKDNALLSMLDEIIDSAPGLPIGNYLSQYFANFYLSYFDHWIKEVMGVKHYFRYADDIVIFSDSKESLHQLLADITLYLQQELKLTVKGNYQVFPVHSRGVDFLGYVYFHHKTRVRKTIKKNCFRMLSRNPNKAALASYNGWFNHADCNNLKKKINGKKIQRF
jgi:RNA-directed DNA polymerase